MVLDKFIVVSEDGISIIGTYNSIDEAFIASNKAAAAMAGSVFKVFYHEYTALIPKKPKVRMLNSTKVLV